MLVVGCSYPGIEKIVEAVGSLKKYQVRGGKRPGSGRKKNSPNKASAKREREVAASGATPLDKMLRSMRLLLALQVTLRRLAAVPGDQHECRQHDPNADCPNCKRVESGT